MPNRRLLVALCVVWGLASASYAYVGSHSRMIADDYCTADVGVRYGSIGGVSYDYENWDGSVTNSILKSWLAPLQPQFHHVQTLLFIGSIALASLAVLSALAPASSWWARGMGALFFTFLACYSSPNPRNLYWFATLIPYSFPFVWLLGVGALTLWGIRARQRRLIAGLLSALWAVGTFAMTTSSPTYGTALLPLCVLVGLWGAWRLPKDRRWLVAAVTLGATVGILAGLLVVLGAPGNAVRQEAMFRHNGHTTPSLPVLVLATLDIGLQYILQANGLGYVLFACFGTLALLHVLGLPLAELTPVRALDVAFVMGLALLAVFATVAPAVYGAGVASHHIFYFPRMVQVLAGAFVGYYLAVSLARAGFPSAYLRRRPTFRLTQAALGFMLFFVPLVAGAQNLSLSGDLRAYAQAWDARDAFIRAEVARGNRAEVVVEDYPYSFAKYMILEEMDSETPNGMVRCAERYYGIDRLRVVPIGAQGS